MAYMLIAMSDDFEFGKNAGAGFDTLPKLTGRRCADVLLGPIKIDMQIAAMRSLLHRNRIEDARLRDLFTELEEQAETSSLDVAEVDLHYGELFYRTVYQDGTHALAALGMIAPLAESVFVRLFEYVAKMGVPKEYSRWRVPDADLRKWNCKLRWCESSQPQWNDDIVGGVDQMAKMVDIDRLLTPNDRIRVRALFTYRNYMFHNGIEWPEERAAKFAEMAGGWPDGWFGSARVGGRPWIFYLTDKFADDCFCMLERFVEGVGDLFVAWNERTGNSFEVLMRR